MRPSKEEEACTKKRIPDLVSTVKELNALSSPDLSKLIRNAENGTIHWTKVNGSSTEINVENLARYLPLHLVSKSLSYRRDETLIRHLLRGLRLLHMLCDLASRHSKLDQVLFDDVNVSEQMLDLIFYMAAIVRRFRENVRTPNQLALLCSALLASSFYLLTACISSQWHDLTQVLLAHPKIDIFMTETFPAVRVVVNFLQAKLSAQDTDTGSRSNLAEVNHLSQYCEASLQFLQSLCQQKLFRERLVKQKELCEEGGVLLLVRDIMKLPSCEEPYLMAMVSRLKSKVLSILLHLCEAESFSFLDMAHSTNRCFLLAMSSIYEIMFSGDFDISTASSIKEYPRGISQLTAMRLTEILSDDSNFRSHIMPILTEALITVFSLPCGKFLSSWCSSELEPSEEDVTLDYDSLAASGWVLGVISPSSVPKSSFSTSRAPQTSYAHQRTSLLIKIVANLVCYVENVCKEEDGLFLNTFLECLKKKDPDLPDGSAHSIDAERAASIGRNLRSLLVHTESLIPRFLNDDDLLLFRMFIGQLEAEIASQDLNIHQTKEVDNPRQHSSPAPQRLSPDHRDKSGDQNEALDQPGQLTIRANLEDRLIDPRNIEPIGSDPSTMWRRNSVERMNTFEIPERFKENDEMVRSEEKQLKRRKRNIMNDIQVSVIENALRDEPDMQRKAASIHFWADKLSLHGSEVTANQLKNWLNNRKAKLARAAAKDARIASGGDEGLTDKQGGSGPDSPESPADEFFDLPPPAARGVVLRICGAENPESVATKNFKRERGQYVVLTNEQGEEMGRGCIHLTNAIWFGRNLEESGLCVVDITYLKVDKWTNLPHPCDATGTTFGQAEQILGRKRVLWDSSKLLLAHHQLPPPPPQPR